jgi:acyl dehydratase
MRPILSTAIVGVDIGPLAHRIDARWLMAYAAAVGEDDRRYFDTRRPDGPLAHPMFPVCYEWPAALALRAKTIPDDVAALGVHATHRLVTARLPCAGDTVLTSARVIGVRRRNSGTLVTTRFTTVDEHGDALTRTDHGSIYRGVGVDGNLEVEPSPPPARADGHIAWTETVDVAANAAHVYTECARIWNPIHTDIAVARAAGLPGLILHGTATLALALSRVFARDLPAKATPPTEIAARFTGMVVVPSRFTVRRYDGADTGSIAFDAVDGDGRRVLVGGVLGA